MKSFITILSELLYHFVYEFTIFFNTFLNNVNLFMENRVDRSSQCDIL